VMVDFLLGDNTIEPTTPIAVRRSENAVRALKLLGLGH